jgi:hypothetical protein
LASSPLLFGCGCGPAAILPGHGRQPMLYHASLVAGAWEPNEQHGCQHSAPSKPLILVSTFVKCYSTSLRRLKNSHITISCSRQTARVQPYHPEVVLRLLPAPSCARCRWDLLQIGDGHPRHYRGRGIRHYRASHPPPRGCDWHNASMAIGYHHIIC